MRFILDSLYIIVFLRLLNTLYSQIILLRNLTLLNISIILWSLLDFILLVLFLLSNHIKNFVWRTFGLSKSNNLTLLNLFRLHSSYTYLFHWIHIDREWQLVHPRASKTYSITHLVYTTSTKSEYTYNNTLYELIDKLKHQSSSNFISLNSYSTVYNFFNTYFYNDRDWDLRSYIQNIFNRTFGFGSLYLQGFIFILFIDACLTDDEPLWEPIEWSLVQSWILIIFSFAWIAENLIVSRYGSYTGRDKRVWLSWYKTFWLIEGYYIINYGAACIFVIVPFYFETNYNLSFVYSWWHWYSRVFF